MADEPKHANVDYPGAQKVENDALQVITRRWTLTIHAVSLQHYMYIMTVLIKRNILSSPIELLWVNESSKYCLSGK